MKDESASKIKTFCLLQFPESMIKSKKIKFQASLCELRNNLMSGCPLKIQSTMKARKRTPEKQIH